MKKILVAVTGLLLVCGALYAGAKVLNPIKTSDENNVLTIFNWGDYIDPKLITEFERETGYQVIYEPFDSNEAMYTKIKQGGTNYDIAIPSDYMIEKMKKGHLLTKLDLTQIPNFKNLDTQFLHKSFDPQNQYSVPYFWGTLGIVYNHQKIKASELQHFDDLWKPQFKRNVLLVDSARDVLGFSLRSLGYSMNTTNLIQLKLAQTKLNELGPNIKAIVADEMKMYMAQNEALIGVTWSGEASEMLSQNPDLTYFVPNEGSNLWFDNMVIPKTVKNKKAAYAFINFMLEEHHAAQNAEYIGYATPVKKAKALLPKSIREDKAFYPDQPTMNNLEVYQDLAPRVVQDYNDLFLEFKMQAR